MDDSGGINNESDDDNEFVVNGDGDNNHFIPQQVENDDSDGINNENDDENECVVNGDSDNNEQTNLLHNDHVIPQQVENGEDLSWMDNDNDDDGVVWVARSHQDYDPIFLEDEDDDVDVMNQMDNEDEDDFWPSDEQEQQLDIPAEGFPKANEWIDVPMSTVKDNIIVQIDGARRILFNQLKTETEILFRYWSSDLNLNSPTFGDLSKKYFGKKSKLFHLFVKERQMSDNKYCCFLATFFCAAKRKTTPVEMLDNDRFIAKGLMDASEYQQIIRLIEIEDGSGGESL